jgi:hypothetical protein
VSPWASTIFAQVLVSETSQADNCCMWFASGLRADKDIDDRLGDETGHCSASEVLDPGHIIAQRGANRRGLNSSPPPDIAPTSSFPSTSARGRSTRRRAIADNAIWPDRPA